MAEITWKNIAAPDLGTSVAATQAAGQNLNRGFDAFKDVAEQQQNIEKQNYENTTKNNNQAISSRLQELGSLKDFNAANEEGAFNIAALKEQYGSQFSPELAQSAIKNNRARLEKEAYSNAIGAGTELADNELDITAGTKKVYESMREQGASHERALEGSTQFSQNSAVLKNRYTKTIKDNTDRAFADLSSKNLRYTDDISKAINGYQGKNKIDKTALTNRLTQYVERKDADTLKRNKATYSAVYSDIMGGIYKGGDSKQLMSRINQANLPAEDKMRLNTSISESVKKMRSLTDVQQNGVQQVNMRLNADHQDNLRAIDTDISTAQRQYEVTTGVTPEIMDFVKQKNMEHEGGIVGYLTKGSKDIGWVQDALTDIDVSGTGDATEDLQKIYDEVIVDKGLSNEEGHTMLYLAMQDSYGENQANWGGTGVNGVVVLENLNKRVAAFKDAKGIRNKIALLQEEKIQKNQNFAITSANKTNKYIAALGKYNQMGKSTDFSAPGSEYKFLVDNGIMPKKKEPVKIADNAKKKKNLESSNTRYKKLKDTGAALKKRTAENRAKAKKTKISNQNMDRQIASWRKKASISDKVNMPANPKKKREWFKENILKRQNNQMISTLD